MSRRIGAKLDLRSALARVAHLERQLMVSRLTAKMLRRAGGPPDAFVTICSVTAGRGSFLHALDGWGVVWKYNFVVDEWNSLSGKRGGPVAVRAVDPVQPAKEA